MLVAFRVPNGCPRHSSWLGRAIVTFTNFTFEWSPFQDLSEARLRMYQRRFFLRLEQHFQRGFFKLYFILCISCQNVTDNNMFTIMGNKAQIRKSSIVKADF